MLDLSISALMIFINDTANFMKSLVMVFGVFDGLHPGHFYFLRQARRYGKLYVVVARDGVVWRLKGRKSRENERTRVGRLKKLAFVSRVFLGDRKQGSYALVKKVKPEVICFGYDQKKLEKDIRKKIKSGILLKTRLVRLKAYNPRRFKSSQINKSR